MAKTKKVCEDTNYCIVIPFVSKEDYLDAIDKIKGTRPEIQGHHKGEWWCDGMIIDEEDYKRLLNKSKSIEIVNELENEEE